MEAGIVAHKKDKDTRQIKALQAIMDKQYEHLKKTVGVDEALAESSNLTTERSTHHRQLRPKSGFKKTSRKSQYLHKIETGT